MFTVYGVEFTLQGLEFKDQRSGKV